MTTILLHADPAQLRQLLAETAAQAQIAGEFTNSPAGLEAIKRLRPDVVFASLDLPDLPCSELLAALSDLEVEIVALSQWGTFAYEAIRFGAIAFLLEPLRAEDFLEVLPRVEKRVWERRMLYS